MHWKTSPLARRSKELKGTPLGGVVEQMNRFAARQSYRLHEDVLSNPESRRRFAENAPRLDDRQQEVVGGLEHEGMSIVPLTEFFPDADDALWSELRARGDDFAERARAERAERLAKEAKKGGKKGLGKGDYIVRLLGKDVPALPADDPWLRLGVSEQMLDAVNSYFGLWSKLTYVDLWYTPPAEPGVERVSSQRWHRDYNDARLVKVFVYLTDVDEDTGPLEFVLGSTPNGEYGRVWPWRPVSNDLYPPQQEFEERIPKSAHVTLTAPEGSMVFCNTSGFHRGGYVTGGRPRVMAVYNYSSPASLATLTLRNFRTEISPDRLSEQAAFALEGTRADTPGEGRLAALERWADRVVADSARLPEGLTGEELREQEALWYADFYTLEDGWLIASPDDSAMRDRLVEDEGMTGELADDVLEKMRARGAARVAP